MRKKKCNTCKKTKAISAFHRAKANKDGYKNKCKLCVKNYHKEWSKSPEAKEAWKKASDKYYKENWAKKKYGMEQSEYREMVDYADARCMICGETENLHIDHNHSTGVVRGILCRSCNHGLGNFKDDIDKLHRAVLYLENNDAGWRSGISFGS